MSFCLNCPLKLKNLPTEPCSEGRKAVDAERKGETAGCSWFVADAESNYCFYAYMANNGNPDSSSKVARLLMIEESEVKKIEKAFRVLMQNEIKSS